MKANIIGKCLLEESVEHWLIGPIMYATLWEVDAQFDDVTFLCTPIGKVDATCQYVIRLADRMRVTDLQSGEARVALARAANGEMLTMMASVFNQFEGA